MPDPVQLIRDDHEQMRQQLYRLDRRTRSTLQQKHLVDGILIDLTAHVRVGERLFYPAVREMLGELPLLDRTCEEHRSVKVHLAALARMVPDDSAYLERFGLLREFVEHHMAEEELELFPAITDASDERMARLAMEMERRWPHYRRDAASALRGGVFASVRGALGQVRFGGRSFASP